MGKRGPKPRARLPGSAAPSIDYGASIPACPEFLDDYARREWRRIVPELQRSGTLTRVDRSALAAYCDAFGQWKQASREMKAWQKAHGTLLIKTPQGPIKHPCIAIKQSAAAAMMKFAAEFGFSPASRGRMSNGTARKNSAPAAATPRTALAFVKFGTAAAG